MNREEVPMMTYIAINRSPASAAPASYGLNPFALRSIALSHHRLREYGVSRTWVASQSTLSLSARTVRLRRTHGEVDIDGLGYG
jgi:hypothetical protein